MTIGPGKKYIKNTEMIKRMNTYHILVLLVLPYYLYIGRDGPKAGMVPFIGQLYEFWMGCSLHHLSRPHPLTRGGYGCCCLRTLYFKCFIIKRFKSTGLVTTLNLVCISTCAFESHTVRALNSPLPPHT